MEKTAKSISYKEFKTEMDRLDEARRFIEFWRYSYIQRHVIQDLFRQGTLEDVAEHAFGLAFHLQAKYGLSFRGSPPQHEHFEITRLLEFMNCLIYSHHKGSHHKDYKDAAYEQLLQKHKDPLKMLKKAELKEIEKLHSLSIKYGYLIYELYQEPNPDLIWDAFIEQSPEAVFGNTMPPLYPYCSDSDQIKGIEIIIDLGRVPKKHWDLAIYYNHNDTFSHIKRQIVDRWDSQEVEIIGDNSNYDIALFVDRSACKKHFVLNTLEMQISHLKLHELGGFVVFPNSTDDSVLANGESATAQIKNLLPDSIDGYRISENLSGKSWEPKQNNIRRAIGLYHWDKVHTPSMRNSEAKAIIKQTIQRLHRQKVNILNQYHSKYSKLMKDLSSLDFDDRNDVVETVIREMERDIKLTNDCIEQAAYLSPTQSKSKSKSKTR